MESKIYFNYHKHTFYSNTSIIDVQASPLDYINRAKELGHTAYFTTEHGCNGNPWEAYDLCKKNDLKLINGMECYFTYDRHIMPSPNWHIIIIGLNYEAFEELNYINSMANIDGFYKQPRVDMELLLSLNPENFIITTACINNPIFFNKESEKDAINDYLLPLLLHFGNNLFLEIQSHNDKNQIAWNKKVKELSLEYRIKIIHGNDSHYILKEDKEIRDTLLKGKSFEYDYEDSFVLDYPTYDEILNRYDVQGVFNRAEIIQALDNTLVFDKAVDLGFTKDIKMPTIYPNLTLQERENQLKKNIYIDFIKYANLNNFTKEQINEYRQNLIDEMDVISKTNEEIHIADYFLLNEEIVKKGIEYGGKLTKSGRGCFLGNTLVPVENGYKPIEYITIGDKVYDINGRLQNVIDTLKYDVCEPLIKINYSHRYSKHFPIICTLDHKFAVKSEFIDDDWWGYEWVEARYLKKGDLLISPNIEFDGNERFSFIPFESSEIIDPYPTIVYDLTVEDSHTYMVNNVAVHNSAVSYFMNMLLGFTNVDRLKATVPLYPSRFIATARLLESRSLPDIDMNMVDDEPFIRASKEILGENNVYRVVAYGTMQESSAFKNLCRAKGIDASISNTISKDLEFYSQDEKWKDLIEESKKYIGVIENISPSPCSFIMNNQDIRRIIGVRRVKKELCACIDGYTLDVWKFLKNDFLIVSVWDIIYKTFEMINKDVPSVDELLKIVDDKVWELYEKGITCTLNQADSDYATSLVKRYKPKSIAELCSFVAIIRPSCASLLQDYIDRKPYTTGTPELDELLESSKARMIYQESLMRYFHWLGIPESETYDIIKKISKKKFKEKELEDLKKHLSENWLLKVGNLDNFEETWQVVESAAGYGFNASHAYCVALDSLYGAYLKANYPLEYYTVVLNVYQNDQERTNKLINELSYFGIRLHGIQFGKSSGGYMLDKNTNSIYKGIGSLKGFNMEDGNKMYNFYQELTKEVDKPLENKGIINNDQDIQKLNIDFINVLPQLISLIGESKVIALIKLGFFKEFGGSLKLLQICNLYKTFANIKTIKKDKEYIYPVSTLSLYCSKETEKQFSGFDGERFVNEQIKYMQDKEISIPDRLETENEYLGYLTYVNPKWKDFFYCLEVKKSSNNSKYILNCYKLDTGESVKYIVKNKSRFIEKSIAVGTVFELLTDRLDDKFKLNTDFIEGTTPSKDKWIPTGEYDNVLVDWKIIYQKENAENVE